MPNYSTGKIYTIRYRPDTSMIYVGATTTTLSLRFGQHKSLAKSRKPIRSFYKNILNNHWSDWYIELYEEFPCENKEQLSKKEGDIIRKIGTLNYNNEGLNKQELNRMNCFFKKVKEGYKGKKPFILKIGW